MAGENNTVFFEDWIGGEPVVLIRTVIPNNVTNLTATNVKANTVTLSWTASTSENVIGYEVYNGAALLGTTANTTYDVTGLTAQTSYNFTVKTKNAAGNTSQGTSITVTTATLSYALSLNGTSDYIFTPTLTFDTVIMDFSAEQKTGSYNAYLDASRAIPNSAFSRSSAGYDILQAAWKTLYVNQIDKTSLANSAAVVPTNQRTTIQVILASSGKAPIYIFANQLGQIPLKGILYSITIKLGEQAVASYDFTKPFTGTSIPDRSGNNNNATLKGGTWING